MILSECFFYAYIEILPCCYTQDAYVKYTECVFQIMSTLIKDVKSKGKLMPVHATNPVKHKHNVIISGFVSSLALPLQTAVM